MMRALFCGHSLICQGGWPKGQQSKQMMAALFFGHLHIYQGGWPKGQQSKQMMRALLVDTHLLISMAGLKGSDPER